MFSTLPCRVQTSPVRDRPAEPGGHREETRAPGPEPLTAKTPVRSGRTMVGVPHDQSRLTTSQRIRAVANAVNLTTPLGLGVSAIGRARVRRGPRGLLLAEHYGLPFPRAGAFTVGNVVVTARTLEDLTARCPGTLDHEDTHAWQYAAMLGLPFLPLYGLSCLWSWLRTGDWASGNPFERHAGLVEGGYTPRPVTNAGFRALATGLRGFPTGRSRRGS